MPGVGEEEWARLVEVRCETIDQQECGFDDELLISRLVLDESLAIVVSLEPQQEVK